VTRNTKLYQEVYSEMPKMPTEQSITYEKSGRTSFIGDTPNIMAENQYRHCQTITKIK